MSSDLASRWGDFEPIIGLEVHAQLLTKTKLFCRCSTEFNAPSNANTCPICNGHPGTLPVLNKRAVEFAVKAGLALGCKISLKSVFSRKNYFYPDLPKGYQISQYDEPVCLSGFLDIDVGGTPQKPELAVRKRVGITRIHMEEDAGKSVHMTGYSLVNLNRASVPLIEIVSEPDIRSPEEAGDYLRKLRTVLMYIGVCDGNMQEGSFRCDANVSVRPRGSTKFGTRAEIKNVNSFRFVEKAITYEIERQIQLIQSGGRVVQETRLYDSAKNVTQSMRSKEEAHDYRYFPEPDLVPLVLQQSWVDQVKSNLEELPDQKRDRYINEYQLPAYDASVITSSQKLAAFFEAVLQKTQEPKMVSNWVMGELLRLLKAEEKEVDEMTISVDDFASLLLLIKKGTISNSIGKTVFEEMYKTGEKPEKIVQAKGLIQVSDEGAIEKVIDQVLNSNPTQLADYRSGKDKLFGFFVGQVMKQMGGKGNPAVINQLLKKKLDAK
jgi:aspartyl-tRNA(Asn)/glutamyl-tRNA(Gln) amidotransferase subunit B